MRKLIAALTAICSIGAFSAACTPPHDPGMDGPCRNHQFSVELAVVDALGNVAARMTMVDTVCALPNGYVISNTASQEQHNIGFYALIDGGNLEEHPLNDGIGPTGAWIPDRITEVHWNMDLLYGFLGHGITIGHGNCTLRIDLINFLDDFQIKWYQGWCSQFASRMGG